MLHLLDRDWNMIKLTVLASLDARSVVREEYMQHCIMTNERKRSVISVVGRTYIQYTASKALDSELKDGRCLATRVQIYLRS